MSTMSSIREFIDQLPAGNLFTTRQLLSSGTRGAVDQALWRLVTSHCIERLARGVFRKSHPANPIVSAYEVARTKSEAFFRQIALHGADAACKLGLLPAGNTSPTFCTSGRASSFKFKDTIIHTRQTSPQSLHPGDTLVGLIIRALRFLGASACSQDSIATATSSMQPADYEQMSRLVAAMPAWMSNFLCRSRQNHTFSP